MEWPAWLDGTLHVLDVHVLPALLDLLDVLPALLNFVALLELLEGGPGGSEGGGASDSVSLPIAI